ncbi:carbohydrate kinase family protein [Haloarchaeobius amylolyticus]|uniref:carbohydrate kinase family protein n=1 Tax=Haloarchaeobius amylolyticus TaxID=1198296 RepID=UPI0022710ED0|nr:carbohydrate kinase [Haloarchaeobius amylolyticus]
MTAPRILVAGETLVDFLPERVGPLTEVESFDRRSGGAPANVAVALARLGHTPWFWTRVGDDPFGEFLTATLDEEGLPPRFVERDPDAQTTLAFVTHDADADRSFSFYRDGTADTRMEPGRVPDETLESVESVVCGGVTLAAGRSRDATLDLLARAQDHDCTVWFDPNYRPELWPDDDFAAVVGDALADVDVLKATEEELDLLGLSGDSPEALAEAALDEGPHTVLMTRGSEGSVAIAAPEAPWDAERAEHPGYEVDPVDATGAGDAFLAGSVAATADGETELTAVLAYANAVAAVATTAAGAMAALPSGTDVGAFRNSAS